MEPITLNAVLLIPGIRQGIDARKQRDGTVKCSFKNANVTAVRQQCLQLGDHFQIATVVYWRDVQIVAHPLQHCLCQLMDAKETFCQDGFIGHGGDGIKVGKDWRVASGQIQKKTS